MSPSNTIVIRQGMTGAYELIGGFGPLYVSEPRIVLHEGDRAIFTLSGREAIQALKDLCEKALAEP